MKYIKTKEGIFEVGNKGKISGVEVYFIRKEDKIKCVPVEDVIEESEKLEELIDEYVVDCKHKDSIKKHPFIYTLPKNINEYYLDLLREIQDATIIYGAIWTEAGLKYVAKMNKYGELELIK